MLVGFELATSNAKHFTIKRSSRAAALRQFESGYLVGDHSARLEKDARVPRLSFSHLCSVSPPLKTKPARFTPSLADDVGSPRRGFAIGIYDMLDAAGAAAQAA